MACFGEIMHGDVCALSNSFQPRIFPGGPRDYSNSFEAEAWENGWIWQSLMFFIEMRLSRLCMMFLESTYYGKYEHIA